MITKSVKISYLVGVAAVAMGLCASQASAADAVAQAAGNPYYVSVFAGVSIPNDIMTTRSSGASHYNQVSNTGYLLGGAIGMKWNDKIRTEIELSHSHWGGKTFGSSGSPTSGHPADVSATYLLGNVWLDMNNSSAFTPYVGGGLGAAFVNFAPSSPGKHGFTGDNTVLAYQLGAGVNFAVSEKMSIDVGYRYKGTTNFNILDSDNNPDPFHNGKLGSHNVQVGLTVKF